MLSRKSFALLAAVAAGTLGTFAKAETVSAPSTEQLTLVKPLNLQAAAAEPSRKPLMAGLNALGLAKPLEDANINIGGFIEASTTFYVDRSGAKLNNGRGFDAEDQDPTLNQVDIFVERTVDPSKGKFDIGGRIEWIYGGDARFIHSTGLFDYQGAAPGDNDNQFDPVQFYGDLAIPVGNGLKVRFGKFVTPAGFEVINPTQNWLYSRGLLFTYLLPFTHTGVVVNYSCTDALTTGIGVVRGWDDALEDKNNDGVTILVTAGYAFADKKSNLLFTGLFGPEYAGETTSTRSLFDFVFTHKFSDEWAFAVEADLLWETDKDSAFGPSSEDGFAMGFGGWASYTINKYVQANGRLEYLYDGNGMRFTPGLSNNVYSATIGVTVTPLPDNEIGSNLKIRPEMRYDYCANGLNTATGAETFGGENNQLTFAIEGYFTF
jgi:hypothetical protein